jgi:uroporphyrinogen-III synthase
MLPLAQRRILITRSRHQASDLAARLAALGADPVLIPTIDVIPPESFAALDEAIAHLDRFDWLLFTSANAVQAFRDRTPSVTLPPKLQIAAIGPSTARAAADAALPISLVPPKAIAESLSAALIPHLRPGSRILLVRATTARDHLPETLTAAGAEVTIAPAYRTVIPAESVAALEDLFRTPASYPDAITFTSSSTASNLLALLEAAHLTLPPEIIRASIGPITTQTLRDLNLPPHLESVEATIPSLTAALEDYYSRKV